MECVSKIVYRQLTDADFFNINKPRDMEQGGGGQTYIDFPTRNVSVNNWENFFSGIVNVNRTIAAQGPSWQFPIFSLGLDGPSTAPIQNLKVYQRRGASICISSQKLDSSRTNRVRAWHPDAGFPYPADNTQRALCPSGLMVYLAATTSGKVWAGWYLNDGTTPLPFSGYQLPELNEMFETHHDQEGYSGLIELPTNTLFLDPLDSNTPLKTNYPATPPVVSNPPVQINEEQHIDDLFLEDTSPNTPVTQQERVVQIRRRNRGLVSTLKSLYNHTCQVTGTEFLFQKKDGTYYTEAHHLIPLGEGGSDRVENLIVISPQIHSMLHHANVTGLDLNNITFDAAGYGHLNFYINDKLFTITWHPSHASLL
ncbi:hypothetical protein [Shewanella sp. BJSY2023SW005]|uniref:HNH endonuclease n=1 Tax=Shewanella sp. BJSY2023SW005 TaxID=3392043 RepID=UPI0039B47BB9